MNLPQAKTRVQKLKAHSKARYQFAPPQALPFWDETQFRNMP